MQLSTTTDYAIRIVLYLIKYQKMVKSAEFSEKLLIPKTYVLKVTKKLEGNGIVKTCQGIHGGIKLIRPADQITLWDIVSATEATTTINKCLDSTECCELRKDNNCPVRATYIKLQHIMEERLKSVKLIDMID